MSKADVIVGGLRRLAAERRDKGKPYFSAKLGEPPKVRSGRGYGLNFDRYEPWSPEDIDKLAKAVKAHADDLEALL